MATPRKTATATATAANPDLVLLTAIEPIRYDTANIAPGETFAAAPDVAEALLDSGAARLADAE